MSSGVGLQWKLGVVVGTQWELRRALSRTDQRLRPYDAFVRGHVATEGRAESEAEKVRGAQEGGKRRRVKRTASDSMTRSAASRRPRRVHEELPSGQNAHLRDGGKVPRLRATGARQFPLRPYTPWQFPLHPYRTRGIGEDIRGRQTQSP